MSEKKTVFPCFELVSNPTIPLEAARAYHMGLLTFDQLVELSVDTVTGKKVDRLTVAVMASASLGINPKKRKRGSGKQDGS